MRELLFKKTKSILAKNNIFKANQFIRFPTGRNNQVWKISNTENHWIIKIYPKFKNNYNLRLLKEFKFLKILEEQGIFCVPKSIDFDKKRNLALYTYIPGKRVNKINDNYIDQILNFIYKINKSKNTKKFKNLPKASDSCFSLKQHIFCVQRRINEFKNLKPKTYLEQQVYLFFKNKIFPEWENKKREIENNFTVKEINKKFNKNELIVSPSDFGFHNIIEKNKKLFFVDFEYAGWDDPAKLICDFICQPDYKVEKKYWNKFMHGLSTTLPKNNEIVKRVKNVLPLHRVKWCCVLLNEFIKKNKTRRKHAGFLSNFVLQNQLLKSKNYFRVNLG